MQRLQPFVQSVHVSALGQEPTVATDRFRNGLEPYRSPSSRCP